MKDLIARVEKATGPDHCLEIDLIDELDLPSGHYTDSLDAVVALVERELPHSYYEICRHTPTKWLALVSTVRGAEKSTVEQKLYRATHNSAALALLLAFLRAKERGR